VSLSSSRTYRPLIGTQANQGRISTGSAIQSNRPPGCCCIRSLGISHWFRCRRDCQCRCIRRRPPQVVRHRQLHRTHPLFIGVTQVTSFSAVCHRRVRARECQRSIVWRASDNPGIIGDRSKLHSRARAVQVEFTVGFGWGVIAICLGDRWRPSGEVDRCGVARGLADAVCNGNGGRAGGVGGEGAKICPLGVVGDIWAGPSVCPGVFGAPRWTYYL
jgi:hypothetical protein